MKISLHEFETDDDIIDREHTIYSLHNQIFIDDFSDIEQYLAAKAIGDLRVANVKLDISDERFLSRNFEKLHTNLPSIKVVTDLWHRPFSGESLKSDLEDLCSGLLQQQVRIRTQPAVAIDFETRRVGASFPAPISVTPLLRELDAFIRTQTTKQPRYYKAIIALIFLLRIHPFADGNGRTSRAFFNFVCRNTMLIKSPTFFLSPLIYANVDLIDYQSQQSNFRKVILIYLDIIIKYFTLIIEFDSGKKSEQP
ncbi:MAG: Fic family protein [Hyphomonadaceae bacterium]|nr:Fic family protein [Hyphomonadaceae bacterium]